MVVRDLDSAQARLAPLGFRFKAGRLHPDNLLNRHIKFRDGTELELMSLHGPPLDRNARDYADLLATGEGGAYVALTDSDLDRVANVARALGLPIHRSTVGTWQFLSFARHSDASAVFFGSGWSSPRDDDSIFAHTNTARGLAEAWLEGGPRLGAILRALGAVPCDSVPLADGRVGQRWALASGALVIVPPRRADQPGRPFGAVLSISDDGGGSRSFVPFPGFWLVLRETPRVMSR